MATSSLFLFFQSVDSQPAPIHLFKSLLSESQVLSVALARTSLEKLPFPPWSCFLPVTPSCCWLLEGCGWQTPVCWPFWLSAGWGLRTSPGLRLQGGQEACGWGRSQCTGHSEGCRCSMASPAGRQVDGSRSFRCKESGSPSPRSLC